MPNPVVHWEINGKDAKKLQSFYAQLFDWHVDTSMPMDYGLVDTHTDHGINGGIGQAGDQTPAPVTFFVEVNDLQAYLSKVERLGGKMVVPPTEIPNVVTFAMFSDPEGNVIGLVKE